MLENMREMCSCRTSWWCWSRQE